MDEDDDFDFDADLAPADPDDPPGRPSFRATIVGTRMTVIHWTPFMADGPLHRPVLKERAQAGVTIADLTVTGKGPEREVIVRFLARPTSDGASRLLARWAAQTGYRRIWFPHRVVGLQPPARFGAVATTCSNCGITYRESDPSFWATVRENGTFPSYCMVCGGDLPQWAAKPGRAVPPGAAPRPAGR